MLTLTPEEQKKVTQKSKSTDQLPKYYNAESRTETLISRDFEAFLILASEQLKTKALDWINKVETLQDVKSDRDKLFNRVVLNEYNNSVLKLNKIEEKLLGYDAFRKEFQDLNKFASIPEVTIFLKDLQSIIPEITMDRSRYFHDQTVSRVEDRRSVANGQITADRLIQLQSWSNVLSSYF